MGGIRGGVMQRWVGWKGCYLGRGGMGRGIIHGMRYKWVLWNRVVFIGGGVIQVQWRNSESGPWFFRRSLSSQRFSAKKS